MWSTYLTDFAKDPANVLPLYEFSAIANNFPIKRSHLSKLQSHKNGVRCFSKKDMAFEFSQEAFLRKPTNTLGYQVAKLLNDDDLTSRYDGFEIIDHTTYADARLLLCHDVYHVLFAFPTTPLGEIGLHAALFAQNHYPRAILIVAGLMMSFKSDKEINSAIKILSVGYRRGANASDLFSVDWSTLWDEDVKNLRERFSIQL